MVLHGAGDESEGERAEPKPRVLDEKEETLLSFNQLPEAEKLRVILHTKAVLQEMDLLKNNVFDLINDLKNRTKELIHTGSTSLGAIFMLQDRTFSCTFALQIEPLVLSLVSSTTSASLSGVKRSAGRR